MKRSLAFLIIISVSSLAFAGQLDFRLVDSAGKPVDWGKRNLLFMYQGGLCAPDFKMGVPDGRYVLLGRYLVEVDGSKLSAFSDGVKVDGATVTVNVQPIMDSLFCTKGVAWADGKLYAAETESIDTANKAVWVFSEENEPAARIEAVSHPRAVAVSGQMLYVLGDKELVLR